MKPKRPELWKCERCHVVRSQHVPAPGNGGEPKLMCPDGEGEFKRRPHPRSLAASHSFNAEDVAVLDRIREVLQQGGGGPDLAVLARHPAFARVAGKVTKMKARIELLKSMGGPA